MADLPRIGEIPTCEFPGCKLDGITRIRDIRHHTLTKIVCSLHTGWRPWEDERG